ncbi:MAG: superoxide dismutase [Fe] [Actinobacteria bacterium]|uniref:superoxide dismutase n=2 Tax=freshwater metagenome TaxID=449393 RepID=A0A6J6PFJ0_9ZZZZ|nr:superoxide dismutase [Fe] [Actinomycetota bacterium]
MAFELPPLPYAKDALAPHISEETLEYHYGKHHQTYVTNLNKMVEGTDFENSSLEEVIMGSEAAVFNNSAQIWNHTFYWSSMAPDGGGAPTGEVADAINSAFGSYDTFVEKFKEAATTQFGSGWAWLVDAGSGLEIMKTANADLPMKHNAKALLTIDVWEHAYYIDFRNARPNYIGTFVDSLINWDFVAANMAA